MDNKIHVLYICDRYKCPDCEGLCNMTTDIRHAKNFLDVGDGLFVEKELRSLDEHVTENTLAKENDGNHSVDSSDISDTDSIYNC